MLKSKVGKGEPMVWLTGMGLAIGLIMVIGLLGLIIYRGLDPFWPKNIVTISTEDGVEILGVVRQDREKKSLEEEASTREWQIFKGNRDVFGEAFQYIDYEKITSTTIDPQAMMIERLEYGNAIGFAKEIKLADGSVLLSSSKIFNDKFQQLVTEAKDRWHKIRDIERNKIGAINRKLEEIRIEKQAIENQSLTFDDDIKEVISQLDTKKDQLEKDYQVLAHQAKQLRNKQDDNQFVYTLINGEQQSMDIGDVVDYFYPNQMSFFDRLGHFFHSIWNFLSTDPREANTEGGVFPALFGTFVMTILMSLIVTPFGVVAAIYLREYAKQGTWVRLVRIAVNNLAGVPSIVFGVFGLGFFVYLVGGTIDDVFYHDRLPTPTFGTGGLIWASLTLALMTVPVVIVATEEALAAVTRGLREASLACGASKWQTIQHVVLPAAAPGVLTGMVLAMARGAGEVAPLMLVGVVKLAPTLPINDIYPYLHLDQKFMHLGFYIYDLGFQSPDSEAAIPMVFAATLLLICLVVTLNLGAIFIREKLRRKYASGAF